MLNPRTKDAVDILNGLVRMNNERIRFYENFLSACDQPESDLREFFAMVVGESYQNNIWIGIEIQTIEGSIDSPTPVDNHHNNANTSADLPVAGVLLKNCMSFEDRIRAAYSQAIGSIFIPQYMRDLLKKQVRRLEAARRQLERFMREHPGDL